MRIDIKAVLAFAGFVAGDWHDMLTFSSRIDLDGVTFLCGKLAYPKTEVSRKGVLLLSSFGKS